MCPELRRHDCVPARVEPACVMGTLRRVLLRYGGSLDTPPTRQRPKRAQHEVAIRLERDQLFSYVFTRRMAGAVPLPDGKIGPQ